VHVAAFFGANVINLRFCQIRTDYRIAQANVEGPDPVLQGPGMKAHDALAGGACLGDDSGRMPEKWPRDNDTQSPDLGVTQVPGRTRFKFFYGGARRSASESCAYGAPPCTMRYLRVPVGRG
jgi:hypothetical protein